MVPRPLLSCVFPAELGEACNTGNVVCPVPAWRFCVETHLRLVEGACRQRSLQAMQHEKGTKLRRVRFLARRVGERVGGWVGIGGRVRGRVGGLHVHVRGCLKS